jgi:adenylosuccinate synthase
MKPTTAAKSYYDLPKQARAYIEFIEQFVVSPNLGQESFPPLT